MSYPTRALSRSLTSDRWPRLTAVMLFVLGILAVLAPTAGAEPLSATTGTTLSSEVSGDATDSDVLADGRAATVGQRSLPPHDDRALRSLTLPQPPPRP